MHLFNILSPRPNLSPHVKVKKRRAATTEPVTERRASLRTPPQPPSDRSIDIKEVPARLPELSILPALEHFEPQEAPVNEVQPCAIFVSTVQDSVTPTPSPPSTPKQRNSLLPAPEIDENPSWSVSAADPSLFPFETALAWSNPSRELEENTPAHVEVASEEPSAVSLPSAEIESDGEELDDTDDERESLHVTVGSTRSRSSSVMSNWDNKRFASYRSPLCFETSDTSDQTQVCLLKKDGYLKSFVSADGRLSMAIATLNSLQDTGETDSSLDTGSRRLSAFRRSSSLPTRQSPDETLAMISPPTSPRRRGQAPSSSSSSRARWLVSIIHMSPSLPSIQNLASEVEQYNNIQRPALRQSLAEVQSAQSHLLLCLSRWASHLIALRQTQNPPASNEILNVCYKERIIFLSQAIVCGYLTEKLMSRLCLKEGDSGLEKLKSTASVMGEALEALRDMVREWTKEDPEMTQRPSSSSASKRSTSAPNTPKKTRNGLNPSSSSIFQRRPSATRDELEVPEKVPARRSSSGSLTTNPTVEEKEVLAALTRFDESYHCFGQQLVSSHVSASEKRRLRRNNRLYSRMQQTCTTLGLAKEGLQVPPSTHLLVDFTLRQALVSSLLESEDDTCELSPKLFVVIPRLCIFYGITEATLPNGWEVSAVGENANLFMDHFFPRVCRVMSLKTIVDIRGLSLSERELLQQMLAGNLADDAPLPAELSVLHRAVCAGADQSSQGSEAKRWAQIMKESLRCLADGSEESLPTPEDVARDLSASVIC